MYSALAHDSQWLETCRAQIDGIRAAYAAQSARAAGSTGKTAAKNAAAITAKPPGL
jgi:hypothetical protein